MTLVRQIWQQCCLGAFIPSKYRHRSFIYDIGSEMWILVKQMWLWSFKYNHRFNLFFQALYTSTKTVYNYAKDVIYYFFNWKEQVISNLNVVSLQYCSSLDMLTKSIEDGFKDVLMSKYIIKDKIRCRVINKDERYLLSVKYVETRCKL